MDIKTGPIRTARVFGITAIAVLVIVTLAVFVANAIIADTGFAIAAFLIILPFTMLFTGALGLVAVILSIVVARVSERPRKGWVLPFILGLLTMLVIPAAFLIWIWAAG